MPDRAVRYHTHAAHRIPVSEVKALTKRLRQL
jgi:hypothetical protein